MMVDYDIEIAKVKKRFVELHEAEKELMVIKKDLIKHRSELESKRLKESIKRR